MRALDTFPLGRWMKRTTHESHGSRSRFHAAALPGVHILLELRIGPAESEMGGTVWEHRRLFSYWDGVMGFNRDA